MKKLIIILSIILFCFSSAEASPQALNPKDFDIKTKEGLSFSMGQVAQKSINALNDEFDEKLEITKAKSCMFKGQDKEFFNKEIIIGTQPRGKNGEDIIETVILLSDRFISHRNICIGMSRQEMEKAYGLNYVEENNKIIYQLNTSPWKIVFILDKENNIIQEIDYFLNTTV